MDEVSEKTWKNEEENEELRENEMVRVASGIPGLDDMIEGGFPFPSVVLVAGSAGTGKTTFSLQFLFAGAEQDEQGLFFTTLSEPTHWMLQYSSNFSFVKKEYFGNLIQYVDLGSMLNRPVDEILRYINEKIAETMPQRIVIDPVTIIGNIIKDDYRKFLFDLTNSLKSWQAVSLLTGEVRPGEMYPVEVSYAADSVILLSLKAEGNARRKYLEILKMRGTDHRTGAYPVSITREDGFVVLRTRF